MENHLGVEITTENDFCNRGRLAVLQHARKHCPLDEANTLLERDLVSGVNDASCDRFEPDVTPNTAAHGVVCAYIVCVIQWWRIGGQPLPFSGNRALSSHQNVKDWQSYHLQVGQFVVV